MSDWPDEYLNGLAKRAERAEADRDTYRAAWNRAEAELARLREAAKKVVEARQRALAFGGSAEVRALIDQAQAIDLYLTPLTQENKDAKQTD